MTPVTFFVGVAGTACFGFAVTLPKDDVLRWLLAGVGCIVVLVALGLLVYFAAYHPDRLQTEEHVTSMKQLDMIATKGGRIPINPVDLHAIANPYAIAPEQSEEATAAPEGVTDGDDN